MEDKKLEEQEINVKKGKFIKWLDNYWYHYKWPTIIVAFFVVVFAVSFIQSATKKEKDILITYAGSVALTADEKAAIETLLSDNLPEGFGNKGADGDAGLTAYLIYSAAQIKEQESKQIFVDTAFNSSEYSTLNSQYKTGNGSIYLLEKWLYDELVPKNEGDVERLKPLSEIFGETPSGAVDKYGIRLGDTEIYKNSPALQVLPADTMICLHEQILGQKKYDKEIEAFKAIAKLAVNDDNEE